jgi:hypothetical protein
MSKKIPLLAESLRDCLETIKKNFDSKIADDLLQADDLIITYNNTMNNTWGMTEMQIRIISQLFDDKISTLITDEVRALSVRKDVFEIAFTPKGKELKYSGSGTWSRENRQTGKPGRIIKKLLAKDYKERDIELFSNQLKAEIMCLGDFKIVEGEDICYWYDCNNYYLLAGTLGNSCMKYCECQNYFQVYQDIAKMLICVKDGKLLGRAILWEIDGKTYMDRVYVCMDYLEEQFYQKAMDNNWIIRADNALLYDGDDQNWLIPDDKYSTRHVLNLVLKCLAEYEKFPYMDSFRYFNPVTLELYCCVPTATRYATLSHTDGYWDSGEERCCSRCGDSETVFSDDEDGMMVWSDYEDGWLCPDCRVWNDWIDDYISIDTSCIEVETGDDTMDVPRTVVLRSVTEFNEEDPYAEFVHFPSGAYYDSNAVTWSEKTNTYKIDNE